MINHKVGLETISHFVRIKFNSIISEIVYNLQFINLRITRIRVSKFTGRLGSFIYDPGRTLTI